MKKLVIFVILLSSIILTVNAKSLIGELLEIFFTDLEDPSEYSQYPNVYQNQYQQGYNQGYSHFPMYQNHQGNKF